MTIEFLYLTTQMQHWLNLRVARHLEAQAAKLKPAKGLIWKRLETEGPGGAVSLDLAGLPAGDEGDDEDRLPDDHLPRVRANDNEAVCA